jgi:DNA-binding MarR family transcriptional regulator
MTRTRESRSVDRSVVADRLHSLAIHLLRRIRRHDDATGVPAPSLSALSVVVFVGPVTLGDLARAEQVRPPSMTRVVQDLEARGLVVREQDGVDRRVTRIRATAKGRTLMRTGRSRRIRAVVELLEAAGEKDLRVIERAIEVLEPLVRG